MSVSLNKGDRVELSKDSRVNAVSVCLGWDTAKYDDDGDFDLDASTFVIGRNGMTRRDEDFIFYNNLQHPSGGITHSGDVYGKYWWMIEAEEKMKKYIYEVKKQL